MHRTYKFALCKIGQWPWTMDREISSFLYYFVTCFGAFLNTHHMKKMAISTLDRLRQFPFTLGKKRRGVQIGFCFCVRSLSILSPFSFLLFFLSSEKPLSKNLSGSWPEGKRGWLMEVNMDKALIFIQKHWTQDLWDRHDATSIDLCMHVNMPWRSGLLH